jgi:hypothetical protein
VLVKKTRAVEVIRDRPIIVAGCGRADPEHARDRSESGESGKQAAAGEKGHRLYRIGSRSHELYVLAASGIDKFMVQSCKREALALRQLKVCGVVESKSVLSRERKHIGIRRDRCVPNSHSRESTHCESGALFG